MRTLFDTIPHSHSLITTNIAQKTVKVEQSSLCPVRLLTDLYLLSKGLDMHRFVKNFFISFDALAAANHAQIFVV